MPKDIKSMGSEERVGHKEEGDERNVKKLKLIYKSKKKVLKKVL